MRSGQDGRPGSSVQAVEGQPGASGGKSHARSSDACARKSPLDAPRSGKLRRRRPSCTINRLACPGPIRYPCWLMSFDLIIRNATLPDGRGGLDIAVAGGRIAAVERGIAADAGRIIDAE